MEVKTGTTSLLLSTGCSRDEGGNHVGESVCHCVICKRVLFKRHLAEKVRSLVSGNGVARSQKRGPQRTFGFVMPFLGGSYLRTKHLRQPRAMTPLFGSAG